MREYHFPVPSFRAKREIYFVRGETAHKRKAKNGKPAIRKPSLNDCLADVQSQETYGQSQPFMTLSLAETRPAPSFRAEREILFVRGKTAHKRKAKNRKPAIRKPTLDDCLADVQSQETYEQSRLS